jgi:CO/xanthine dehydrogenase FAD-binding subunit
MDLITVRETRVARTRDDVRFGPGERPLGGGTWLFSEVQPGLTGLVDLTGLGWPAIERTDATLRLSATCTIAALADLTPPLLRADPFLGGRTPAVDPLRLFWDCANSLLASFKIWNVATVGGNIALSLPAGPMTSLGVALDAEVVIWTIDGGERRLPVETFVTGVRENALRPGEVVRALDIPMAALGERAGFRRIALSPLGRTGTLVTGRVGRGFSVAVTGGTRHPVVLRFGEVPTADELLTKMKEIDCWYDDAHGASDWREEMSCIFAEELRVQLA